MEPTFPQSVVGFRSWLVRDDGLRSTGRGACTWPPDKPLKATCNRHSHSAPHPDCECGIYALNKPPRAWGGQVSGVIECRGLTQVQSAGFRAEEAQVRALMCSKKSSIREEAEQEAERYGVPLFDTTDELEEFAKSIGSPPPAHLTPPPTFLTWWGTKINQKSAIPTPVQILVLVYVLLGGFLGGFLLANQVINRAVNNDQLVEATKAANKDLPQALQISDETPLPTARELENSARELGNPGEGEELMERSFKDAVEEVQEARSGRQSQNTIILVCLPALVILIGGVVFFRVRLWLYGRRRVSSS